MQRGSNWKQNERTKQDIKENAMKKNAMKMTKNVDGRRVKSSKRKERKN